MKNERVVERLSCDLPAVVYSDGRMTRCEILDISQRGCQLSGDVFAFGNEVELHLQDARICVPGRVVWKTYQRIGIEFKALIGVSAR